MSQGFLLAKIDIEAILQFLKLSVDYYGSLRDETKRYFAKGYQVKKMNKELERFRVFFL